MSGQTINRDAQDILFREARTHNGWTHEKIKHELIRSVFDLMKWGPTSANCCPARFVFVESPEAKKRLEPLMDKGNLQKTMDAPMTAIIAHDLDFYEYLPKLFPHTDARSWFAGNDALIKSTAFRNGTLQGGYFMLAARGLGLDCGPMSGFNAEGVKNEFFKGQNVEITFLCNLGYGDPSKLHPRSPRFAFDDVCKIV